MSRRYYAAASVSVGSSTGASDAPFADAAVELARVTEAGLAEPVRAAVLGGTLAALLEA